MKTSSQLSYSPQRRGFALVATLSVIVLLAFVAVGLLTLSSVSKSKRMQGNDKAEARKNAELALQEALGSLQSAMGPDQRVTSLAGSLPAGVMAAPIASRTNTVGVWNSWKIPNTSNVAPNYVAAKTGVAAGVNTATGGFVQWLTSGSTPNAAALTNGSLAYPTSGFVNPVTLVDVNTVNVGANPSAQVVAEGVPVTNGLYAWHVFDESQKINIGNSDNLDVDQLTTVTNLNQTGKPGFSFSAPFAGLSTLTTNDSDRFITYDSISLSPGIPALPLASNAYHELTTDSKNLLVDVTTGQLQTDLSLLFSGDALPASYSGRHLYSDAISPVATTPARYTGTDNSNFVQPLANPDPTWNLLHSHYRLYRDINEVGGEVQLGLGNSQSNALDEDATPIYGTDENFHLLNNPEKDRNIAFERNQQILPVISNAQFIYSLASMRFVIDGRMQASMVTDAVITLWNPYDVHIEFDNMEFEFYRFPASFAFYKRDKDTGVLESLSGDFNNPNYYHTSSMHNSRNISATGADADWSLRDSVPYRVRVNGASLAPGEYKTFAVNDFNSNRSGSLPIMNHTGITLTHGMVLDNDFNPTAGGSITPVLMMRDDAAWHDAADWAWIYGDTGDSVTIAAKSRMVEDGHGGFSDLNGEDPSAFIKIYIGDGGDIAVTNTTDTTFDRVLDDLHNDGNRMPIGSIVLNTDDLSVVLPDIDVADTPEHTFGTNGWQDWQPLLNTKTPMVIASLRLKTEDSTNNVGGSPNSRIWLNNGLTNPYFSNGFSDDQDVSASNLQYELTWEPMTDWNSIPTVEHIDGRGYGGVGVDSETGVHQAIAAQIPKTAASSIAQLSHAPIANSGVAPFISQAIGNSFATTVIPQNSKNIPHTGLVSSYLDHSYLANSTLYDGYFFSTAIDEIDEFLATTDPTLPGAAPRNLNAVLNDFFTGVTPLRNYNFIPKSTPAAPLTAASFDVMSSHIFNKGAFNVNSTSIAAWEMLLSNGIHSALPILTAGNAALTSSNPAQDGTVSFSRFSPLQGDNIGAITSGNDPDRWSGLTRRLTPAQITTLATNIVAQVRLRGPFQSVSEFVNRRLEPGALGNEGALQAAINASGLNNIGIGAWKTTAPSNDVGAANASGTNSTADGALDYLTQADILNKISPSLTVRGDTFKIRAYGDHTNPSTGNVTRVWCEAVVQRIHDYVDSADAPTTPYSGANLTNQQFGRKFKIVSLRWLDASEI